MVFEQMQADLEAAGYEVWAYILPAAGVGAPHRRDRVWIVAYTRGDGCGGHQTAEEDGYRRSEKGLAGQHDVDALFGSGVSADADGGRWEGRFSDRFRSLFETAGTFQGSEPSRGIAAPDWSGFPTESPFCARDDGISGRLDGIAFSTWRYKSLRGAGNAIVPGVVMQIFRTIELMDGNEKG